MEGYQIQSLLELLIVTTGTLTGLWIVVRVWTQRRSRAGGADITRMSESIDKMRESVEQMRDELVDVGERLEFTERVLARLAEGGTPRQQLPSR